MRNVCIKKTIRGSGYVSIVRRCAMIALNENVGTCHDPVSRGLSLEFCQYCDYDGCNSATGLKTNIALASISSLVLILFFRKLFLCNFSYYCKVCSVSIENEEQLWNRIQNSVQELQNEETLRRVHFNFTN
ncbi:hypothetical protein NQ317_006594 [Molorchus minor]|uniref:Protein sleepless n=1 Tax=Molorchus minor TaxID=1323400 RepID=A0ABQ9K065_9CUCU|nr:hypothetical protein NQ317_006594 [Molorchus minor]